MAEKGKIDILFIINPIAGGKLKSKIPELIVKYLDAKLFELHIEYTEYAGHAGEIIARYALKQLQVVIAAGGDGTMNEVASAAVKHGLVFGVLPLGSGNGLARALSIPLRIDHGIKLINKMHTARIDVGKLNAQYFFNVAGLGFDAELSMRFSDSKNRGLKGYLQKGFPELLSYKAKRYNIWIDGQYFQKEAFALTIANSNQYGNNVIIASKAKMNDAKLDICFIKPFAKIMLPKLAYVLLSGQSAESDMIEIIQGKSIKIENTQESWVHIDGEARLMQGDIEIELLPLALEILIP